MIIDILVLIFILIIGWTIPLLYIPTSDKKHLANLRKLFVFHLISGIGFFFITSDGGGDAWTYWKNSQMMTKDDFLIFLLEGQGTRFMEAFNYFFANTLGLSFFVNTMSYVLLGYIGIVFFYISTLKVIPFNSRYLGYRLFPLIFFFPSFHFWSSGIGKDTVLFLCIGMFVYGLLNIGKRLPLLIISMLLSFLIRPHITFFLVISYGLAYLFGGNISGSKRIMVSILLLGGGVIILPTVLEYVKIDEASAESFEQFSEKQAQLLSREHTGSAVDISSYPLPLKVFTFLYRPFFFDINGIPAVIASFENLIIFLLSIKILKHNPIRTFKGAPFIVKGFIIFLLIGTLAFSQSLGNVGIMIRMRNMFLPGLFIFILWSFSFQIEQKQEKKKIKGKAKGNEIFN